MARFDSSRNNATGIRIKGLSQLQASFRLLPDAMYDELRASFRQAGAIAAEMANAHAPRTPVGVPSEEAPLDESYRVRLGRTGVLVGSPLMKAPIVEFGRKALHPGHGHTNRHLRILTPKPHLIPAIDQAAIRLEAGVDSDVQRMLDKVFDTGVRA